MSRPRVVTLSCWLWLQAAVLAVATVALALTRLGDIRAELARVTRDSDPSATPDMVDRVVDLSVLVIVGGGLLLGVVGALVAVALRAGRRWSRVVLTTLTLLAGAYGVLVMDATGWPVLAYSAVTVAGAVCMYLPGARGWFA